MEAKLRDLRNRRRQNIISRNKVFFRDIMERLASRSPSPSSDSVNKPLLSAEASPSCKITSDDEISIVSSNTSNDFTMPACTWLTVVTYLLYFMLWVTTYFIAIQLEFGYVYLVLSGLVLIYYNTRTGPKKEGEVSAYSVFNPNCEAIDGTLKAEQFEREFNLIKHVTVSPSK